MRRLAVGITMIAVVSMAGAQQQKKKDRPTPPTRDPLAAGFVSAKELPDGEVPPPDANGNFILGPTHDRSPLMRDPHAPLDGKVIEFTMSSADSKFYPGIARDEDAKGKPDPADPSIVLGLSTHPAPYTRRVAVYVPKGVTPGKSLPFIVGCDGPDRLLFQALDGLIAAGKLPPIVAVSIGNGGGDGTASERGLEYDTVSGRYAEFVEHEVLPRVEKEANITLTKDPDGRAAMGNSSGGSAALSMAWFHPEWYHRVLTTSGTYVNQQWPHNDATPHGAWEFHEHLIPESSRKPIRIWMEVGDRDLLINATHDNMHDWVEANERMAKVLAAKGYDYQFVFARNAGHGDPAVKGQIMPEALEYLWQGYKAR